MLVSKTKKLKIGDRECRSILSKANGTPILFLHGFSYTSEIWRKIGILEALTEKGIPYLALDMPYGKQSECVPKSRNEDVNVKFAISVFKEEFEKEMPIIIVGASMGGHIALKCAMQFPTKGLLLISPTRTNDKQLLQAYNEFNFPIKIIWGSKDNIVAQEELQNFKSKLHNAKISTYEGAGHSAYKDQPEKFKMELLELYKEATE